MVAVRLRREANKEDWLAPAPPKKPVHLFGASVLDEIKAELPVWRYGDIQAAVGARWAALDAGLRLSMPTALQLSTSDTYSWPKMCGADAERRLLLLT